MMKSPAKLRKRIARRRGIKRAKAIMRSQPYGKMVSWEQIIRLIEFAAVLATITAFWVDFIIDRPKDRAVRAATMFAQIAQIHVLPDGAGLKALKPSVEVLAQDKVAMIGLNLSGAYIDNANLREVNLSGTNLQGANLSGTDFRLGILEGVLFNGADLKGANFGSTNLVGADFRGVDLSGVNFSRTHVGKRRVKPGADLRGADLRDTTLIGANLSYTNLSNADLRGADLSNANLSDANLSGADLRNTVLSEVTFWETTFRRGREVYSKGANLSGANLRDANGLSLASLQKLCIAHGDTQPKLPDEFKNVKIPVCKNFIRDLKLFILSLFSSP